MLLTRQWEDEGPGIDTVCKPEPVLLSAENSARLMVLLAEHIQYKLIPHLTD